MLLRRSSTLVMYWYEGDLVVENYLLPRSKDGFNAVAVDPLAVDILARFEGWVEDEEVAVSFGEYDSESVLVGIKELAQHGLLRTQQQWSDEGRLLEEWPHWSQEARFFHFGTKDCLFDGSDLGMEDGTAAVGIDEQRPSSPIFKTDPSAPRIYLPRAWTPLRADFADVLITRRTHRSFTSEPVDLLRLSTLLHYVFAPMRFIDAGPWGTVMLKTSACGGARHELECYLGVLNVSDLQPGLYHYAVEDHSLEVLDASFDREKALWLGWDQPMCGDAAFVCMITAVFWRSMYKYRHPRAYRVMLLDAGHLGQTFAMVCTALGLGPFQTAAFRDTEIEQLIGIDGFAEGVLYVLGAGIPTPFRNGLPQGRQPTATLTPTWDRRNVERG